MSDHFAAEGYGSSAAGMRACEVSEDRGLHAGEYEAADIKVHGERAEARLILEPAGERSYSLVRGGAAGWEIDGYSERFNGRVGGTFPYRDAYKLNGQPVTVNAQVSLLSVKDRARPNANSYLVQALEKPHTRWVRARIQVRSRGRKSIDFITSYFQAVDVEGQRYQADFSAFEPPLGNGILSMSGDDIATGYIGFQIPDRLSLAQVRYAPEGNEPMVWSTR